MLSPKAVGPLVPVKKIFKGFFTIDGRDGHLGHVIQMRRTYFHSP